MKLSTKELKDILGDLYDPSKSYDENVNTFLKEHVSNPVKVKVFDYNKIKLPASSPFYEVHLAPTPNGGAYSIGYFYDKNHQPCKKEIAKFLNIVEYDENNNRINECYGILSANP